MILLVRYNGNCILAALPDFAKSPDLKSIGQRQSILNNTFNHFHFFNAFKSVLQFKDPVRLISESAIEVCLSFVSLRVSGFFCAFTTIYQRIFDQSRMPSRLCICKIEFYQEILHAGKIFTTQKKYYFHSAGSTSGSSMQINSPGNVSIGTTIPDAKLTVKGTIHTEEVKVDLNVPSPDYVFEKDYDLLPLAELEIYINQHKHLPEVPSAKDMEEKGLNLKEMNLLLLKKVEEMTLHLIKQNKTNPLLIIQVQELQNEVKNIKTNKVQSK